MGRPRTWPRIRAAATLFSLGVTLAACAEPRVGVLYGQSRELTPQDYPKVLDTWTRTDRVYSGLDNKVFVTATFHAPEFRRAFAIAFPEVYGTGGKVTRRELVDLTGNVEQYLNFFMSVYTPDRDWNDLHKADSIWRLTLIGANEVAVGAEEVIRVKVDPNLRAVFPYLDRFGMGYIVRFPLSDAMGRVVVDESTQRLTLRMASALGVAEMEWRLRPTEGAQPLNAGEQTPAKGTQTISTDSDRPR